MPLKQYNSKADFDADYDLNGEPEGHPNTRPGIRLGYCRAVMLPVAQLRAAKLVEIFAWPTSTRIFMIGAGYAWTAEVLEQQYGYSNIVTSDTSPYVQSTQDQTDEAEINAAISAVGLNPASGEGATKKARLYSPGNRRRHSRSVRNEDLSNGGSRNRIKNVLGGVDVAISEDLILAFSDAEVLQAAGWIDAIDTLDQVIHMVTELGAGANQNPVFNWKTIEGWKALVPSHTFMSLNDWAVV